MDERQVERPRKYATAAAVILAALWAGAIPARWAAAAENRALPLVDNALLPPAFKQGEAVRADASRMVFFVSDVNDGLQGRRPVLIYVEGSGAQSHFPKVGERIGIGIYGLIARHAGDRYHVAATEKRGVEFGDPGKRGVAEGASVDYNEHATLAERVADLRLLLDVLLAAPNVDANRVLVVGHSEGADVAAAAAAEDPRITHVAFLAGGGAAQFFDFFVMRRKQMAAEGATPEEVEQSIAGLEGEIRAVLAEPASTSKFYMGHAYKRWATFATTASADNLVRTRARLYLGHGTEDTSVPIESFDFLVVELLRHGRTDFVARRYVGCDHSFMKKGEEPSSKPFLAVLDDVLAWVDAAP